MHRHYIGLGLDSSMALTSFSRELKQKNWKRFKFLVLKELMIRNIFLL
jgi:hypothetical protein